MKISLRDFVQQNGFTSPNADHLGLDALIVGAGFSGNGQTAAFNGPICIEFDPTAATSHAWKYRINKLSNATLFLATKSTYMGGISSYHAEIRTVLQSLKGFSAEMQ
ncbi:hypothetical protein EYZ11_003190 [Aspergillus tanneri]|uniref:Uncharacterized protein n=1 Tax=Aspergillus tanneri TaxID=1220188 RepID=A0A4S3JNY6_9EURO|nr:hypothetical protein EYZ11_003190 [Aspergillus tanneri]